MAWRKQARWVRDVVRGAVHYVRVQRRVSSVLGPQYRRSRSRIEIDLTWACNLNCFNCNRSCEQAPTGEKMSKSQIEQFVAESVAAGKRWERIRLLGGEPTLHPAFHEILEVLRAYRRVHAPGCVIEVATNGYGPKVAASMARIPPDIAIDNTEKTTAEQPFSSFNVAPVDLPAYGKADYRNGCWVTENCGVGLGPYGYYPCAVAAGIDRITGEDLGRPALPADEDDQFDQLETFCRMCGGFKRLAERPITQPKKSDSWVAAYESHGGRRRELTRYGGTNA